MSKDKPEDDAEDLGEGVEHDRATPFEEEMPSLRDDDDFLEHFAPETQPESASSEDDFNFDWTAATDKTSAAPLEPSQPVAETGSTWPGESEGEREDRGIGIGAPISESGQHVAASDSGIGLGAPIDEESRSGESIRVGRPIPETEQETPGPDIRVGPPIDTPKRPPPLPPPTGGRKVLPLIGTAALVLAAAGIPSGLVYRSQSQHVAEAQDRARVASQAAADAAKAKEDAATALAAEVKKLEPLRQSAEDARKEADAQRQRALALDSELAKSAATAKSATAAAGKAADDAKVAIAAAARERKSREDQENARREAEVVAQKAEAAAKSAEAAAQKARADATKLQETLARLAGRPEASTTVMVIDQAKEALKGLDGVPKARKQVEIAALELKTAFRLAESGNKQADVDRLREEAVQLASEARASAMQSKDPRVVMDAVFNLGQAYELGKKYDKALEVFREGVALAPKDSEYATRFELAVYRVNRKRARPRQSSIRSRPDRGDTAVAETEAQTSTDLRDSATLVLALYGVALQPPPNAAETPKGQAEYWENKIQKATSAEERRHLAEFYLNAADLRARMGDDAKAKGTIPEARDAYERAARHCKDGLDRVQRTEYDPDVYDLPSDLERLSKEVQGKLARLTPDGGKDAAIERLERELAEAQRERMQAVESASTWLLIAGNVARALDETQPPADTQQLSEWGRRVVARANTLREQGLKLASELKNARSEASSAKAQADVYHKVEQRWTQFAQRMATDFGYADSLPDEQARLKPDGESMMQSWLDGLASTVASRTVAGGGRSQRNEDLAMNIYAEGLDRFYAGSYPDAITKFNDAIRIYPRDARFYYFRGIARLLDSQAGHSDLPASIKDDMRRGFALEQQGHPWPHDVSHSLVRVQDGVRNWVETFRNPGRTYTVTPVKAVVNPMRPTVTLTNTSASGASSKS